MKTLKLIGLGNNEGDKRSSFWLEKSELFIKIFNNILNELDIDDRIYDGESVSGRVNETDHFKNDDYDIDVIYTKNMIILLVRGEQENLEKVKSLILDCSKMEE